MATLSEICVHLPEGWGVPKSVNQTSLSMKQAWKEAKRKDHDRLMAYRERERRRGGYTMPTIESDRRRVYEATIFDGTVPESRGAMFASGKGERTPKRAKNRASSEEAGTIGRTIVEKRFSGSRTICVCKSLIIY